jgi:hypothetical protein
MAGSLTVVCNSLLVLWHGSVNGPSTLPSWVLVVLVWGTQLYDWSLAGVSLSSPSGSFCHGSVSVAQVGSGWFRMAV